MTEWLSSLGRVNLTTYFASTSSPRTKLQPQAASGIGRETAYSFAEAGASGIVFADINKEGAQEAAEESKKFATNPNYRTVVVEVDVTDPASVQAMVDVAVKEFRQIDYNVNSAGVSAVIIPMKLGWLKQDVH